MHLTSEGSLVLVQLEHVIDLPWWWHPARLPWLVVNRFKSEVNSLFIRLANHGLPILSHSGGGEPRCLSSPCESHCKCPKTKKPRPAKQIGVFRIWRLTMTYSHMGKPHTTIGDASFHFWVRDGVRWFQRSMVVKQFFWSLRVLLGLALHVSFQFRNAVF